ncbi:MAG TPA: three-Cys-motif partner protein TcmP [Bacteroidia bacterium]|nr:three-Cys-motif partner protein TcmP [Bacteroidia bacterium]
MKKENWGGNWTEEKLETFEHYVIEYLTIMNSQKKKYNGWPTTIYFDGFAGSGSRYDDNLDDEQKKLFSDFFNDENNIYRGSAERVLNLTQKFDEYYFVDVDETALRELKIKLYSKNLLNDKCYFIAGDVNSKLKEFSEHLDRSKAALIFLDPFGMQIEWSSIECLKDKRVDLWILVPSGVIINRLLDKQGELKYSKKLESFFGLSEEEIRKKFYKTEKINTLFGNEKIISKEKDTIQKIANIYVEKLKSIFKFVTEEPLKLMNRKNITIYHFVFASNNPTAHKIAKYIIEKKIQKRKK